MRATSCFLVTLLMLCALQMKTSAHGGNNDADVVHACIANYSKVVRIVGATGSCIAGPALLAETPAHWAIKGTQGNPGSPGANGTSVLISGTLPEGDSHCPTGGVVLTDGSQASYYLCNGRAGVDARPRPDGPCFQESRYVDCGNGTVTDTVTGLIWLKQADCLGADRWVWGNESVARLATGQCGLTDGSQPGDWRLPTKDEWQTTVAAAVARGCSSPALTDVNGYFCLNSSSPLARTVFSGILTVLPPPAPANAVYWSSSAFEGHPDGAWSIDIINGALPSSIPFKDIILRLWPVRSSR